MWPQTTADLAPVWCDISTRQSLSESPRRLCASTADSTRSRRARRSQCPGRRSSARSWSISRSVWAFHFCRCRFNTSFKGTGTTCLRASAATPRRTTSSPPTPPSYLWPNIINLVFAVYCVLTLRAFLHRCTPFAQFLSASALTPHPLLPPHGPRLPRAPPQPPPRLLRPLPHRLPLPHRALGLLGQHPRRLRPRAAGAGPLLAERQAHGGDGGAESLGGRGVRAPVLCVLWLRDGGAQELPDGALGGREADGVLAARGRRLPIIPFHRPSPVGQARADDGQRGKGAPDRAAAHPREAAPRVALPLPRRHAHRRRHGLRVREEQRGLRPPHTLPPPAPCPRSTHTTSSRGRTSPTPTPTRPRNAPSPAATTPGARRGRLSHTPMPMPMRLDGASFLLPSFFPYIYLSLIFFSAVALPPVFLASRSFPPPTRLLTFTCDTYSLTHYLLTPPTHTFTIPPTRFAFCFLLLPYFCAVAVYTNE